MNEALAVPITALIVTDTWTTGFAPGAPRHISIDELRQERVAQDVISSVTVPLVSTFPKFVPVTVRLARPVVGSLYLMRLDIKGASNVKDAVNVLRRP